MPKLDSLSDLLLHLLLDALRFIRLSLRPHCALAAENLFLRKQLALFLERKVKARRASDASLAHSGIALPFVCMATSSDYRPAGHFHPLASERLSAVLEVEIETPRTAASSCRTTETDCRDG